MLLSRRIYISATSWRQTFIRVGPLNDVKDLSATMGRFCSLIVSTLKER